MGLDVLSLPMFLTEGAAWRWMQEQVNDGCVDNYRLAYKSDRASLKRYRRAKSHGCCGFFDAHIIIAGRRAKIGCNYGH